MVISIPFPPHALSEHARPRLNILLFGTCQVEGIAASAERLGHTARHILMESMRYAPIPAVDLAPFDAVVVALTLRHVFHDATGLPLGPADMAMARIETAEQVQHLLDRCAAMIDDKLDALATALKDRPIFVMTFLEPSFSYLGTLIDSYSPVSPRSIIRRVNEHLARAVRERAGFHLLDTNDLANFVGRMHLHDDVLNGSTHASLIDGGSVQLDADRHVPPVSNSEFFDVEPYSQAFGEVLWRYLADGLAVRRQAEPVKLIIVDLDDTLWRGVAAEDHRELWARVEGWPIGFVEALLYFKRRGGLLAICSKNDETPTLARMASIWRGAIKPEDFASIRINWHSKAENIAEILAETNLLPGNALFIDDNPRELDEVSARFPRIRVLGGRPHDWRRIILQSPETQVPTITAESARKTELVRALAAREATRLDLPREEWLASLALQQTIERVMVPDSPQGIRAFELINKTNQFNTTGQRWTQEEFRQFLAENGICLVTSLKDRNVDNGIIGVSLVRNGEIMQAVLSCRVFGLGAEIVMGSIATRVALSQADTAIGRLVDSGKNFTCHDYFQQLGFRRNGERLEAIQPCPTPAWINVIEAGQ